MAVRNLILSAQGDFNGVWMGLRRVGSDKFSWVDTGKWHPH